MTLSQDAVRIVHRSGEETPFMREKLVERVEKLMGGLCAEHLDVRHLVDSVARGMQQVMTSVALDELLQESAAYLACNHPDYALLAGRIAASSLHKTTDDSLLQTCEELYSYKSERTGEHSPLINKETYEVIVEHHARLQDAIDYQRDLSYDYFGFKTLEKSYLLKMECDGVLKVVERPQQMLMRVSVGIHHCDIDSVIETYHYMSQGVFTHASPTLFNAGTPTPQMSSCFLVAMKDDSIDGIYDTVKTCAMISKTAGGIGMHIHNIRAKGSYIRGTNGQSNGLVPMLRVFNATARYVYQGGGKRKGSCAIYLEPWHADVFDFLNLKKNTGKDESRARDLFYGLWVPDLFMKRVEQNGVWSLFDPCTSPGLGDCWGKDFDELYTRYESEGRALRTVSAVTLWYAILESQIETGTPYLLYKDACNGKSNHRHLGTIKSSNLCTEIIEYTSKDEVAVCNLASIALPKFVKSSPDGGSFFDHTSLLQTAKVVTKNLNRVIDRNYYPVPEARNSNMRHRPVGIGVQGLADAFCMLGLPFSSPGAAELNEDIFETLYYGALEASMELAKADGPYESYKGSPVSEGTLQFDMWGKKPRSGRHDWAALRESIKAHGVRNSLLVAPMPTASTSQILGNNECFEPFTSNIYVRRVMAGEFPVVNKHLVKELCARGLWNEQLKQEIIARDGSVQGVPGIPAELREIYRTVWEIKQRDIIDMAAARAQYIDQSQSLNLFLSSPTRGQLTSMHFYAWKQGLKTGQYYLRTRPAVDAIKFSVDSATLAKKKASDAVDTEECIACGS